MNLFPNFHITGMEMFNLLVYKNVLGYWPETCMTLLASALNKGTRIYFIILI